MRRRRGVGRSLRLCRRGHRNWRRFGRADKLRLFRRSALRRLRRRRFRLGRWRWLGRRGEDRWRGRLSRRGIGFFRLAQRSCRRGASGGQRAAGWIPRSHRRLRRRQRADPFFRSLGLERALAPQARRDGLCISLGRLCAAPLRLRSRRANLRRRGLASELRLGAGGLLGRPWGRLAVLGHQKSVPSSPPGRTSPVFVIIGH